MFCCFSQYPAIRKGNHDAEQNCAHISASCKPYVHVGVHLFVYEVSQVTYQGQGSSEIKLGGKMANVFVIWIFFEKLKSHWNGRGGEVKGHVSMSRVTWINLGGKYKVGIIFFSYFSFFFYM